MFTLFLQAEAPSSGGGLGGMNLVMLLLLVVVFYFFLIRPQQKRQKELRTYRDSLKKGDKIITTGGIYGKVHEIKDQNKIVLEISDNVRITVDKSAVVRDMSDAAK
jgi:preprotein translocase subunit YajC